MDMDNGHDTGFADCYEKRNSYQGIDPGIVGIIQRLVWRTVGKCGMTKDDVPDLEQELTIAVLIALENVDTSRLVPYNLVKCIAERRLKCIFRRRSAPSRDWKKLQSLHEEIACGDEDDDCSMLIDLVDENHHLCLSDAGSWRNVNPVDMQLDIADALERMEPEQRRLCGDLQEKSRRQLAGSLDKPRYWVNKKLRHISKSFD